MPLTKEELLKPRYLVTADYPCAILEVGQIINTYESAMTYVTESEKACLKDYPHLFQPLQWWEERKPEDMPEHVATRPIFESDNVKYYKVSEWYTYKQPVGGEEMIGFASPDGHTIGAHAVLPIDKEEYQQAL